MNIRIHIKQYRTSISGNMSNKSASDKLKDLLVPLMKEQTDRIILRINKQHEEMNAAVVELKKEYSKKNEREMKMLQIISNLENKISSLEKQIASNQPHELQKVPEKDKKETVDVCFDLLDKSKNETRPGQFEVEFD